METTNLSNTDLLSKLKNLLSPKEDEVEPGFKTAKQFAEEWGVTLRRANELIAAGVRAKLIECKKFRIKTPASTKMTIHYREKNGTQ